jgi:hypothetical protein
MSLIWHRCHLWNLYIHVNYILKHLQLLANFGLLYYNNSSIHCHTILLWWSWPKVIIVILLYRLCCQRICVLLSHLKQMGHSSTWITSYKKTRAHTDSMSRSSLMCGPDEWHWLPNLLSARNVDVLQTKMEWDKLCAPSVYHHLLSTSWK